jgi:hypothetical protein
VANIASLALVVAAAGAEVDEEVIVAAIGAFPPEDEKETVPMIECWEKIIAIRGGALGTAIAAALATALADALLMSEGERLKRNITQETVDRLAAMFAQLLAAGPELAAVLRTKFARSRSKIARLAAIAPL